MVERGPTPFLPQLWQELALPGTLRENLDKQPNLVLVNLKKTLPKGEQFMPLKEVSKSQACFRVPLQQGGISGVDMPYP